MYIIDYAVQMTLLVGSVSLKISKGPENKHNLNCENEHYLFWSWEINEISPYTHSLYQKKM